MMWLKWLPWRFAVKNLARGQGFMDPFKLMVQFQRFAQPSEVAVPVEILRLAFILHARGVMNSQAIQHNLDWVWPYWVERQFDPADVAFVPRAFSLSHINMTHRNWTAVGLPGCPEFPIVDPAGLVTPFFDSWSIDSWITPEIGAPLIPSRLKVLSQKLLLDGGLAVLTETHSDLLSLSSFARVAGSVALPVCEIKITAKAKEKAECVIALRPYNPEGVNFIHEIQALEGCHGWKVNNKENIYFEKEPDRCLMSNYRHGDVYHSISQTQAPRKMTCDVGMATAAMVYRLKPGEAREILVRVPLKGHSGNDGNKSLVSKSPQDLWDRSMEGICKIKVPDEQFQFLYDAALKTMILHSPADVYPGPYTYKHFWFRDAAFILDAMLCAGLSQRAEKVIEHSFFNRQTPFGYFHSQDGEWDSNGQALWTLMRFCELTGTKPKAHWAGPIEKAGRWIERKRLSDKLAEPHAGLFPPGFSAEHLGPNDYFYWDDFWGIAGLQAARALMLLAGKEFLAESFEKSAENFSESVDRSLKQVAQRLGHCALPASPYRRMDTGAIGSIAASYPLRLWDSQDERTLATLEYLVKECLVDDGFFHDMSHSGVNPYLTLHIAQGLLRAGDPRYFKLTQAIARFASPTGQWPEAIHPVTKGGCMGDGQHVWAAAEWILMMHSFFVREEGDALILFSGIPKAWLENDNEMELGPAATKFGTVQLDLKVKKGKVRAAWNGKWFKAAPQIKIHLTGFKTVIVGEGQTEIEMTRLSGL